MTMQTQTALITSRDPKGMQAVNIFEAAYNKAKLDDSRAQRLNERGDELKTGISKLIAELSVSDRYADEEVQSNYTYPREYDGPKPIEEQVKALAEILNLDSSNALEYAKNLPELPAGAEGWFAIPSSNGLKKLFPQIENDADRYCAGVRLVHEKIAASRKFYNWSDRQITPNRLRVHARTAHALDLVAENQHGDILIVAEQLGMRHRGRSVRRARECFDSNEFGLGSLAVGSIVLTHPNRLVRWKELDMDCSGDEFDDPDADVRFDHAPFFIFNDGEVGFGTHWYDDAYESYGSVSAFVPQS
ncbi:MAG: hypothetical protein A3G52_01560 [Candidatus Taylorbacteria bacterium RIFCSPLOWO2_12_FULL_43_20]|uniref:Uncharacterized protein n=1 Tax=Candidatus Taylorbacteria bacterium RIFCSPLOWO2_12_FULL_43_20 TaxID=1802332 RepID=A0A1G2NYX9_9BACT|nr:MAG: hypothetical protein A2825_02130 [Candidatus Taylorbacteria bacterium RIFCSPHIGHO2_01_FULL_43_120]OHA23940.1 MAG: hypothetical protein A3B98_03830 [Candidatus Taylorbacteria bacterium RIFCSPHIGHO2_02_FULL_43_55]OHA41315.1 MAG: hypothetical protein A3G52_01560 [Candidatus Taylorbacteria bacterium RIFCSPLOWO2_12_FULL_43_20]